MNTLQTVVPATVPVLGVCIHAQSHAAAGTGIEATFEESNPCHK